MKTITAIILTSLLSCFATVQSAEEIVVGGLHGLDPYQSGIEYNISLALSGGGSRGLTVIGILRAFEEKGIRVSAVAGTSMGGIIGGLYAAGYSPDRLASVVRKINFDEMFSNTPARKTMFLTQRQDRDRHLLSVRFDGFVPVIPKALTAGQKLTNILTDLTTGPSYRSSGDFDRLPIPFRTICTDVASGLEVVIDNGSMADAMRATMAFPLAFTGVERDGQLLMDGGMVAPVPVTLAAEIAPPGTFVVAINTTSPLRPREELITPVDIANQVTSIMTADQLRDQLDRADYVITPALGDIRSSDFEHRDSLIELGYEIGLKEADSIISAIQTRKAHVHLMIDTVHVDPTLKPYASEIIPLLAKKQLRRVELVSVLQSIAIAHDLWVLTTRLEPIANDSTNPSPDDCDLTTVTITLSGYPCLPLEDVSFYFSGNSIYDDLTLAEQLATSDALLTPANLQHGLDRILNLYHMNKYNLTDIRNVRIDPNSNTVSIEIDEAIITAVNVANDGRTQDWFIKSYFPLDVGDPYSTSRAARGIANIYGTDLFDRVTIDLKPSDSGALVTIGVVEKKYSQFRFGWHWDDQYASEEFVEYLDDNVFGVGLEYLLHAKLGPDRKSYSLVFKTNRIGSTYLTAQTGIYHRRLDRQSYNPDSSPGSLRRELKTGFEIRLGQQIARLGTVTAGINLEEVKYQDPLTGTESGFGLRIFRIESLVETFDRISFPHSGKKHLFELQFVGKFLGDDVEFTRFFSSIESYFPLIGPLNYHPRVAIGISRSGLPPSEKFHIGGAETFAGYHTDELSGDKTFLLTNELRIKLPLRLYAAARYDLGDVYASTDDIKLSNLRHGFSAWLALDSPLGPIKFGYGINDDDLDRFYFNAGLAF